jgi:endonuclease YncB( thermonuclease family)
MSNILILIMLPLISFGAQEKDCQHSATSLNCVQYIRNYDGDTITFNIKNVHPIIGKKISVRLNGIDTPEVKTKDRCEKEKARTARKLVESLLKKAKRIDLENIQRGKYFRIVADVKFDGRDLKSILLQQKLGYEYQGGRKPAMDWCTK